MMKDKEIEAIYNRMRKESTWTEHKSGYFKCLQDVLGIKGEKYNGWANWDTWATHLWLTNDKDLYDATLDVMKSRNNGELVEWVQSLIDSGMILDKISVYQVEWSEIWKAFEEG